MLPVPTCSTNSEYSTQRSCFGAFGSDLINMVLWLSLNCHILVYTHNTILPVVLTLFNAYVVGSSFDLYLICIQT